LAHGY